MFSITKQLKNFSAAHRLVKDYQGKCQHLHGHNYAIEVTLSSQQLNQYDFVIDFDLIKTHFDQWIQTHWDHVTLVSDIDKSLIQFLETEQQNFFLIPGGKNTTVECLAKFLYHQFQCILQSLNDTRIQLTSVRLFESETASALYSE